MYNQYVMDLYILNACCTKYFQVSYIIGLLARGLRVTYTSGLLARLLYKPKF